MQVLKYPLIAVTLFFAAGIAAAHFLTLPPAAGVIASIIVFAFFILALWKANRDFKPRPFFGIAAFAFCACLGMLAYSLHYAPNHETHYTRLQPGGPAVFKGVITERLKPNDFQEKYFLEITAVNKKPAAGKILITQPKDSTYTLLHAGDVLFLADEPLPITRALNPYQFDYANYMAQQGVFHRIKLKENYFKAGEQHNMNYWLERTRTTLIESFSIHEYNPGVMNVIKALLLGQRQDMDRQTSAEYTDAGVIHILAISGLHIAILFFIANFLLKPLDRFSKKGKLLKLVLLLSFLWLFAFVSGLSASVVRSVIMFSFVSIGLYLNRNTAVYNSIAVSMLLLLLVKPMYLFDVGFQLSYAAVLSIVLLQPVYSRLPKSRYKAVNYITDTLVISAVAQIGVLPLCLYYFNQFPLLFLLSNLVVIPLSTVILTGGIITLFLNFTMPALAVYAGKILGALIEFMNRFITWIASLKAFVIKDISFNLPLAITLSVVLVLFGLWLYKKSYYRTAAMLSAFVLFQALYIFTSVKAAQTQELVVFHNYGSSLIAVKERNVVTVYSNDSLIAQNRSITDYNKGNFNREFTRMELGNLLWFNGRKILLLDSLGAYSTELKPDVLVLTQSSKVNLERVLTTLKPDVVVADATSYKNVIARWEATCRKQKIPFHATAEKGFYKLK